MAYSGTFPYMTRIDGGHGMTSMGVIGTLGTLDTTGSALMLPIAVDPVTGAQWQREIGTPAVQPIPTPTIGQSTFGTYGTTGVSVFGTLGGGTSSGAGTEVFITSLSMSIPATGGSQDVSIGWGTNGGTFHAGTGLLVRGMFPAGGGIQKEFVPAINSGTNAQLTYFQAGAGTVNISVTYFITASTL